MAECVKKTEVLRIDLARIRDPYKEMERKLDLAIEMVKRKMTTFYLAERGRKEEEQKMLDHKSMEENPDADYIVVDDVRLQKTLRGELGASTAKKHMTFSVTDESLVPREYLEISEKKVRESIRKGLRSIPGLEIREDISISIR